VRILVLCVAVAVLWPGLALANVRFAVLEFANAATDDSYDALGRGLQSMLTTDLSRVQSVTLVERARLEEVFAELSLVETGRIDPKTAAELGRLSGASHLLDGSFTVVGGTMRLDARLLEVQTSDVVLAESLEGPREDFWDLQKQLVDRLVRALSISLTSKERFALRDPHTADFEAFRSFSSGLALFDDGRYDESLKALERAVAADETFSLAQATLRDYRELVRRLRERADAIDTASARQARLESLGSVREGAKVVAKLQAIAGARAERPRLAALHTLACIYDGDHYDLRDVEDRFAFDRAHDQYVQRYTAEALERFPAVPVLLRCSTFMKDAPRLATFDADFGELVDLLWEGSWDTPREYWKATREGHLGRWLTTMTALEDVTASLHLDEAETIAFLRKVPGWRETLGDPIDGSQRSDATWQLTFARRIARSGDLDAATAYLERLGRETDDASRLRRISSLVDDNAGYKALLEEARHDLAKEYVWLAAADGHDASAGRRKLPELGEPPSDAGLRALGRVREVERPSNWRDAPLRIDEHPIWAITARKDLVTGPRSDPRRASALRYYQHEVPRYPRAPDTLVVVDGVPRSAYSLGLSLSDTVPADYLPPYGQHARTELKAQRPTLDLVIGLRDVAVPPATDPATRKRSVQRPMVMHVVRLRPDRDTVELVRRTSVAKEGGVEVIDYEEQVIASERAPTRTARRVVVPVAGADVRARIGDRRLRWQVPDPRPGFYGIAVRGDGFLAMTDLTVNAGSASR